MAVTVGIDLGTTNSCVVVMEGGQPTVIVNAEGTRTTPSVVGFTKTGERIVGATAKRQAVILPDKTFLSIKRKMGTKERVTVEGKQYSPEEISAMILQKLKKDAEAYIGETVDSAVITVPAYFDDAQRTATKNAGEIAGLNVKRIINEPTAAALAYGLNKKSNETILVFDLGGGTFDVTVLEINDGVFAVRSTDGDTHLGGDDWDQRIINFLAEEFQKENGMDLRKDKQAFQRLREAAEKAKIELSAMVNVNVNLPFITAGPDGPLHLDVNLSRARFEDLTRDLVQRCETKYHDALKLAEMKSSELDEVILVGGSTRMPMVEECVRRLTGKEPNKQVNPDEAVAIGAAVQGAVIGGDVNVQDVVLVDVTPLSLGLETVGGVMTKLIERNTPIPTTASEVFTTAVDSQNSVEIKVFQGEREIAAHNKSLGTFHLSGIPPAPKGIPQVEVTFSIDANGILSVAAKDQASGREQRITIKGSSSLDKNEIERMVSDASRYADQDRLQVERAEAKNNGEKMVLDVERGLEDAGPNAPQEEKQAVEVALADLKAILKGNDPDEVIRRTQTLKDAQYRLASAMYQPKPSPMADDEEPVEAQEAEA